jgi:hypothetical protein
MLKRINKYYLVTQNLCHIYFYFLNFFFYLCIDYFIRHGILLRYRFNFDF